MTYKIRKLKLQFTLGEGEFEQGKGNVLTMANMKCDLSISAYGGTAATSMELSLWGLSLDYMAKISGKSQRQNQNNKNFVRVYAEGELVFDGVINSARINMNQAPDAALEISANVATFVRAIPLAPTSIKGPVKAQDLVSSICKQVGFKFANYGVDITMNGANYSGNAVEQIIKISKDYNFSVDVNFETISIFLDGVARDNIIPYVAPDAGLIGYPIFYDVGICFRAMFSPAFIVGRFLNLNTSLPNAYGMYQIKEGTTHYLSSNVDGGLWETYIVAFPVGPGQEG